MSNLTSAPVDPPDPVRDGVAHEPGCEPGVALESLDAGTVLEVNTRHSCYRFLVLDGAEQRALVTGGSLFPERTEVRVAGATAGGGALHVGWIGVGLKLEMVTGARYITTSRVRSIRVHRPAVLSSLVM
ncbi:MAG: hypothetical protein ACRD3C_23990 [Vicinamibacterales bacterium]